MSKEIKTYMATFMPGKTKGVYGISLVENPAMEGHFLALAKEQTEIKLTTINEERRELIGLVLEPEKPIYRNQDGDEFYVTFDDDVIRRLAHEFYKGGFHQNSSLEHKNKIDEVTFVESWIIEDPKNDKSAALGLSYPKGSWMATMKVDSDEVWNDYVKTGKVKGFSIDALVNLEEVETKTDIKMSDTKGFMAEFRKMLSDWKAELKETLSGDKLALGNVKSADGSLTIEFEPATLDDLVEGDEVWVTAQDSTKVPLPVGEYAMEDDKILVVAEEGKFSKIMDKAPADPAPDTDPVEASEDAKDIANQIKSIMIKYGSDFKDDMQKMQDAINKRLDDQDAKLVEFGKQPAAKPVKAVPSQVGLKTSKDRILATIQEQK